MFWFAIVSMRQTDNIGIRLRNETVKSVLSRGIV